MKITLVCWSAITVGIASIAFVVAQNIENATPLVYRTLWLIFLNSVFWFGSFIFDKSSIATATKPFIFIVLLTYAFVSALMLVVFGFCGDASNQTFFCIHLIIQIALAIIVTLFSVVPSVVSSGVFYGTEISADAYESPQTLADTLYVLEKQSQDDGISSKIKLLRESISYSFQDTNRVRANASYGKLAHAINKLAKDFSSMEENEKKSQLNSLKTETETCAKTIVRG